MTALAGSSSGGWADGTGTGAAFSGVTGLAAKILCIRISKPSSVPHRFGGLQRRRQQTIGASPAVTTEKEKEREEKEKRKKNKKQKEKKKKKKKWEKENKQKKERKKKKTENRTLTALATWSLLLLLLLLLWWQLW